MNMTLLNVATPEELLAWMSKNLTYEGKNKGWLRTAERVIKDRCGHCWETCLLEANILHSLELPIYTVYLENKLCTVTHTAVIYKQDDKFKWFEWAWGKHEGIHEYNTLDDALQSIGKYFKADNGNIAKFTISRHKDIYKQGDSELAARHRFVHWQNVETNESLTTPVYAKW